MHLKSISRFATVLAVSFGLAAVARAQSGDLTGDTITVTGAGYISPSSAVVGPGVEFTGIFGYMDVDFGADTLTLTTMGGLEGWSGFGDETFTFADNTIDGIQLASNSGFLNDGDNTLLEVPPSFTPDSITLDFGDGAVVGDGSNLVFNIESSSVPDTASTLTLLGGALAGLAALRRRFAR